MDPREELKGFAGATHWDGSPFAVDWYAAPKGTWISWPVGGTVYWVPFSGPEGTIFTALLRGDDGVTYGFTHVLDTGQLGRKEAGEPFAQLGDSGIEHLPGDPAHIHFTATVGDWPRMGPDGPVGNVPALQVLQGLGFQIKPGHTPGPTELEHGDFAHETAA